MTIIKPLFITVNDNTIERFLITQSTINQPIEKYYPPPTAEGLSSYLIWGLMATVTAVGFFLKQGSASWIASQEKRMQLAIEQEVKRSEASMAITSKLLETAISANQGNHTLQHELLKQLLDSTLAIMERSLQQSGATDQHVQLIGRQLDQLRQDLEKYNATHLTQLDELNTKILDLYRAHNLTARQKS
jgi:hypothetical protein